jgi:hypothetical protein
VHGSRSLVILASLRTAQANLGPLPGAGNDSNGFALTPVRHTLEEWLLFARSRRPESTFGHCGLLRPRSQLGESGRPLSASSWNSGAFTFPSEWDEVAE